jgi:hypothetical protein
MIVEDLPVPAAGQGGRVKVAGVIAGAGTAGAEMALAVDVGATGMGALIFRIGLSRSGASPRSSRVAAGSTSAPWWSSVTAKGG